MFNNNPNDELNTKKPLPEEEPKDGYSAPTYGQSAQEPEKIEKPITEEETVEEPTMQQPHQPQTGWHQPTSDGSERRSEGYGRPPQYGGWQSPYQGGGYSAPAYKSKTQQPPYGESGGYQQPPSYHAPVEEKSSTSGESYQWNLNDYQNTQPPKKKRNKGLTVFGSMLAVLFAGCVLGFAAYGVYNLPGNVLGNEDQTSATTPAPSSSLPNISIQNKPEVQNSAINSTGVLTSVEIARKVKPSVVGIQTYSASGFGIYGEGSGIIMTADGYIVTNAHVVESSQGIKVILDNDEVYAATLIGADTQSDLAVLKIDAQNLAYADFGNSDQTEVGEKILAIGNPAGMELAGSVTQGIVSAINRNIKTEAGYNTNYIQVDAAINPGNSGGALVNEYGQVIGINSSKIAETEYEGIGFAIPINEAMEVVSDLMEHGRVTGRAVLGFTGVPIDAVDARKYGVPLGIQIMEINPNSDFVNYSIVPGDIITKLDDVEITDFASIREVLASHKPGDVISMEVCRRNAPAGKLQYLQFKVKLIEDVGATQEKQ